MPNGVPSRPKNDPRQYDDLTEEWWDPFGKYAALHWIAGARARSIPSPARHGLPLLDVACGAGLLAAQMTGRLSGWRHIGIDLSMLSLDQARQHGVHPVRADAVRLPFADGSMSCVVAGEVLEHLPDLDSAVAEISRVLAPGGVVVIDTLNNTLFCRIAVVRLAERIPGGPPLGTHDPALLVDPNRLRRLFAAHGVRLQDPVGLRPSIRQYFAWLTRRTEHVEMVRIGSIKGVYQTVGTKAVGG